MGHYNLSQPIALLLILLYLGSYMLLPGAHAKVLSTQWVLDEQARQDRVDKVQRLLSQEQVKKQMIALGVEPSDAKARVAKLTEEELRQLEGKLELLPAGAGVLEVVGIAFLLLLILELVGVIDIFKNIP